MRHKLERRYGQRHLHFVTCSCYRRLPFLRSSHKRDLLLKILNSVRDKYQFALVGYVIMPEHIHLLISEPKSGSPGTVMQVFKQRVSRALRAKARRRTGVNQMHLWHEVPEDLPKSFWQRRFYDFNVWTRKKRIEKLNYMHMNPVKRGLAAAPQLWLWSSYRFYQYGERNLCTPDREPRPFSKTEDAQRHVKIRTLQKTKDAAPAKAYGMRRVGGCATRQSCYTRRAQRKLLILSQLR